MKLKFIPLTIAIVFLLFSCFNFVGCQKKDDAQSVKYSIVDINKFGFPLIDATEKDFLDRGFEFGDTFEIVIEKTSKKFNDVGYFNNYCEKAGTLELVAYPNTKNIIIAVTMRPLETVCSLEVGDTVLISLEKKNGKKDLYENLSLRYSNNRDDYSSDEKFANFREITVGEIGKGKLFRSASPINAAERNSCVDELCRKNNIKFVVNLSDNFQDIINRIDSGEITSDYYKSLVYSGNVASRVIEMDSPVKDRVGKPLAELITKLSLYEGPYLIHCDIGKDRTGFVCIVLEGLMGASYDEILNDYMLTYENLYGINEATNKTSYDMIIENKFHDWLISGFGLDESTDFKNCDFKELSRNYLLNIGVGEKTVERVIENLK